MGQGRLVPRGSSWYLYHLFASCRSLSTGRLTDLLLKAADAGSSRPGSTDSLQESQREWCARGGRWGSSLGSGGAMAEEPERLFSLPQRLLASEGPCTQESYRRQQPFPVVFTVGSHSPSGTTLHPRAPRTTMSPR